MDLPRRFSGGFPSRSARGEWIEMVFVLVFVYHLSGVSLRTGEWIEIDSSALDEFGNYVAHQHYDEENFSWPADGAQAAAGFNGNGIFDW